MKKISIILFSFTCVVARAAGQGTEDISKEIARILKGSPVPSLAAAGVLDGEIVSLGAAGIRKQGAKTEVTVDDKYHLGSCTKSMTATVAAMLVESGKLKWETTVSDIFRDLEIHKTYRKVTLRQLLTNTSGTPGEVEPKLWNALWKGQGNLPDQRMQLVRGILGKPAAYAPGSQNVYSNAGFAIAGAMMETVTMKPYEQLVTEMLFKPLSMDSAGFRAPATNGQIDQPYGHIRGKLGDVIAVPPEPAGDNPAAIAPAGAVHCSVSDFAKYARFHLGIEPEKLLSEKTMKTLHTPAGGTDYAMGWVVTERKWAGGKVFMHVGTNTMFHAVMWVAPEKNFAAVSLCNFGGEEGFQKCDEIIAYLIGKHLKAE